jgi:hypothetical protein
MPVLSFFANKLRNNSLRNAVRTCQSVIVLQIAKCIQKDNLKSDLSPPSIALALIRPAWLAFNLEASRDPREHIT